MIKLSHISKTFTSKNNSVRALDDISLEINEGEIFGIVGKSGVGKSTLLNILSLQVKPDKGTYDLFGQDVTKLNPNALKKIISQTAYIYQSFSLLYNLNVIDNIALPLKLRGMSKNERYEKAKSLLSFVGLTDKAYDYPITLSGGEAQRISIARALITNPKLIFLDEPTSALDESTAFDILRLIKKMHEQFKPTIIFVSHQMQVVRFLCDRVLLMKDSKIQKIGPIKKLATLPSGYDELWGDVK